MFGTVASTLAPLVMGLFTRNGINHFILFTMLGVISVGAASFCPETFGKKCPEEIEEIEFEKLKKSAKGSLRRSEKLRLE